MIKTRVSMIWSREWSREDTETDSDEIQRIATDQVLSKRLRISEHLYSED